MCLDSVRTKFGSCGICMPFLFAFLSNKCERETTVEDTLFKEHTSAITSSGFRKVLLENLQGSEGEQLTARW